MKSPSRMQQEYVEWSTLYLILKKHWDREVYDNIHNAAGFDTLLTCLLDTHTNAISYARTYKRGIKCTAKQYLAISNRFKIPVNKMLKAMALGKPELLEAVE